MACAVPYLEGMSFASQDAAEPPRRMCFVYFPNGCSLPNEKDEENARWRWFPSGEGEDFRFTDVLSALEPFRSDLSVLGGLSHPKSRHLLGHIAGDTWLTGGDVRGGEYRNTVSVDQVAARRLKRFTRYPSLVLSTDGGVGYKSRVSTLSFDLNGKPVPSECNPRAIFERYFAPEKGGTTEERRRSLRQGRKIVDLVLEDAKSLRGRLGELDRHKLEDYLDSLNAVEEQIKRSEAWLDVPRKEVDSEALALSVLAKADPKAYLRTMFDLMVLGFQTDMTRVMTYMMAREDGMGFGDGWPKSGVGIPRGHHTISHDTHEGHWAEWGRYDQWLAQQFAYFVGRMKETRDEHGPLLDRTMVLYGSACSTMHNASNYPLVLAGGSQLGVKHSHYTRFPDEVHCSNLFVSMLQTVGVETESFADSTGAISGVFA